MKIPIYNELNEDVHVGWDLMGENPKDFKLVAKEITMIPSKHAEHVKKHLANRVFDVKGKTNMDREMQIKEIMERMVPEI